MITNTHVAHNASTTDQEATHHHKSIFSTLLTAQTYVFPKARNADAMRTMKEDCKLWNNAKDLTREKSKEILDNIIIKINTWYPKKEITLTKNFYVHGQLAWSAALPRLKAFLSLWGPCGNRCISALLSRILDHSRRFEVRLNSGIHLFRHFTITWLSKH